MSYAMAGRTIHPDLERVRALIFGLGVTCLVGLWGPVAGAGCDAGEVGTKDAATPDAAVCWPGDLVTRPHDRLLVATEQYGSGGGLSVIDLATLTPRINVALTHDDVTVRWFDQRIWVLNRYGADNVMILDGQDYHLLRQFSVRPNGNEDCNPHDLLFGSTCRVYLTCYEQPAVTILDPTAPLGAEQVGQIDLSALADEDGLPELSHMAALDGHIYVAVDRMNRNAGWIPVPPSYLAVIDQATDELVDQISLQSLNPLGPLRPVPGGAALVVATAGDWSGANAGLERIDTATGQTDLALGVSDLGGFVTAFTVDALGCGYAVISQPGTYDTGLVSYCLGGAVLPCIPVGAHTITDVALTDDARLLVTDTEYISPGVRVFDPDTCDELTSEPIPTGFGPGFTNPLLLLPRVN